MLIAAMQQTPFNAPALSCLTEELTVWIVKVGNRRNADNTKQKRLV